MDRTLLIDVSRHNGFVDVAKAKAAGVRGIKVRVSVGDYYTDPRFRETRDNCYKHDMPVGGYHVVRPDKDPLDQLARLYESLDGDFMTMPFTFDCEVIGGNLWANTATMLQHLWAKQHVEPEIYTAKWVTDRQPLAAYYKVLPFRPLHVANYRIGGNPLMPAGWTEWIQWQFSADGNGLGYHYGVDSQDVDLNWFNGDEAAFYDYIEKTPDLMSETVCFDGDITMRQLWEIWHETPYTD